MMNFGEKLRILIEERAITQKELASQLNIAPSTVSSYVQNSREPDFATLKMLAQFFDVSIDYLLDNKTNSTYTQQEIELLRVFRSMTKEQQDLYIEQGKVFIRINKKSNK